MKFLGIKKCVRTGYDFCCYDKQTTKIFAEALKEQLNHDWSTCQGITINDLKNISFRECRAGEVPSINKCIATGKFDEYKSTLFKQATRGIKIEGLEEQIRNAIATEN
jgi:transcriptional antiterminator